MTSFFSLDLLAISLSFIAAKTKRRVETRVLFLLFSAELKCSFIFSLNDMAFKLSIYCTKEISSKEKIHIDCIKKFSYLAQNHIL